MKIDQTTHTHRNGVEYTLERHQYEVPMEQAVASAMDKEMCARACKACPQYGRLWTCPPFATDSTEQNPAQFGALHLLVLRIHLPAGVGDYEAQAIFHDVKRDAVPVLREFAAAHDKSAIYGFAGDCDYCSGACSRIENKPCRFPDLAKPSLEGVGFDISALLVLAGGTGIEWSTDYSHPRTLTCVVGVAYGKPSSAEDE